MGEVHELRGAAPRRSESPRTWAVVLAAGEGSRLAALTRDAEGIVVPKQFCSLTGEATLLEDTLHRARRFAAADRTAVIVAQQQRRWWQAALPAIHDGQTVVQPSNRGTAVGLLLGALSIAASDPLARLLFLPCDHYVRDEELLAQALRRAAAEPLPAGELLLLGVAPEEADPGLGYIVPRAAHAPHALPYAGRFVEKPSADLAARLVASGALWNTFMFAADATTIIELVRARFPTVVDSLETALAAGPEAVAALYERLPSLDFSRQILEGAAARLRVLPVAACGWCDLGTPRRVAACVRQARPRRAAAARLPAMRAVCLAAAVGFAMEGA
jgi:mannose-1-phosphate guanylyltransferase